MGKMRACFQGSSARHEETNNIDRILKRVKKVFHSKVTVFKELFNSGPYYICVVCNHCLYRRSVCTFKRDKFSAFSDKVFSCVESFEGNFYICMTCGKKLQKNCIPCQQVYNQLELCELPKELRGMRRLEKVLGARRLLLEKISIMSKGQSPNLKSTLCNIPIDVVDICNTLSRPADSNGIVLVKLKRKLQHRNTIFILNQ